MRLVHEAAAMTARSISPGAAACFLGLWLATGFSLGTSTLTGPVRWAAEWCRRSGRPDLEKASVYALILLLVAVSASLAFVGARIVVRTPYRHVRLGLPLLVASAAGGALCLWLTPGSISAGGGEETALGSHFTFGPYPTEARLLTLKREGYTAVISLLHPAVVPFEPKLLADEQRAARRVGITIIHLPMLPWVSENTEALGRVKDLARARSGRYYVHCYLGLDRVLVVKRVVEQVEPTARTEAHRTGRSLRGARFERGDVYELEEGVFLTPFPTDEEYLGFVLSGGVRQVVSLLDPEDADDAPWIEKERGLLAGYEVPFEVLPLRNRPFEPETFLEVARRVKALPRPLVVHAFLSPSTGKSAVAEAFSLAYQSDRPPLIASAFREPLGGAEPTLLASHVAAGARPREQEFRSYLRPRGIRACAFVGDPSSAEAREDRKSAEGAGLAWRAFAPGSPDVMDALAAGGPWYVYGALAPPLRQRIADGFRLAPLTHAGEGVQAAPPKPATSVGSLRHWLGLLGLPVPELRIVVLVGPVILLAAGLAASLVGWLRVTKGVRAPYTRKVFHFVIFSLAGLMHVLGGFPLVMLFGGLVSLVVLYAVYRGDGFPFFEAMARPTDAPHRTVFVLVPLMTTALGGVMANVFFGAFAHVGYLVGGWGDAVGEPVGTAWGKHRYTVPSLLGVPATRSLEGSSAVALAGIAAAAVALLASGLPPATALGVGALCGLVGAGVEAVSHHGLDNLTVQVAAAATAYWLL